MRNFVRITFIAVFGWFFVLSCKPAGNDDVIIEGTVTDARTGNAIINANIEIESPAELRKFAKSDSSGKYSLTGIDIDQITDIKVTASAAKYQDKTESLKIAPKDVIRSFDFKLSLAGSGTTPPGGGNDDSNTVDAPPAEPASIVLAENGVQRKVINLRGTGGEVNSTLTFVVRDINGNKLGTENPAEVEFRIIEGPGGGEELQPRKVTTNSNGEVTTNLYSGTKPGAVMIEASIPGSGIQVTNPVLVVIAHGFPDLDHFSVAPSTINIGGYDRIRVTTDITVLVGDKYGNPVKEGTAVYFTTTAGVIQPADALQHTNKDGSASVTLFSGNPLPNESETLGGVSMGGRPGLALITARTINETGQSIEVYTNTMFTTNTALISANPTTFDLDPNGGATFNYTVTDLNGNPMPAGTKVFIESGPGIGLSGSVDFTIGDNLLPGPGKTEFKFSIQDTDDENNAPADLTLIITVTAPNGNITTYDGISGIRRKTF